MDADFDDVLALLRQLWPGRDLDAALLRAVFERGLASMNDLLDHSLSASTREYIRLLVEVLGGSTLANSFP
jgi:hypothetical protein